MHFMFQIRHYFLICAVFVYGFAYSQDARTESPLPTVLVSIAPYKFFVERLAGETVNVTLMVPTGASEHTYEPTSRAILNASKAVVWFRIGESFELRALQAIKSYNPQMKVIDLREGVDAITADHSHGHSCHHEDCRDPHIWLSPKEAKKQAEIIANALSASFPRHKELYQKNLLSFQQELTALDHEITALLHPLKVRTVMVSHPAYAYLARDYDLTQLSIEFEGREPSPQQLTQVLQTARKLGVKTVFIQPQHISKGARLVAKELKAKVVEVDPLSEDYINNLRKIAQNFASQ